MTTSPTHQNSEPCRLYLITPPEIDLDPFADQLAAVLEAGDVACVQLRLKPADDETIRAAAARLCPLVQAAGAAFLVNDRPDLARECGADGVHIGQEDASYAEARKAVGDEGIVGVTCHASRHLAMAAGEAGADYVAFGAFFPTATKQPKTRADVSLIDWWAPLFTVPCVAIGGITTDNCRPLIEAGADFLAVSAGVWNHPDGPAAAVRHFNTLCAEIGP
ncbi:MAG: thiamine phosphate synthase [Pseudomonadota bacterium]